jgi:predicted metal-dependent phosphoesterase TrpH
MRADIAKSAHGYLAEFHCHTRRSHDGFTSEEELLQACRTKGIGLLTITEHDRLPAVDVQRFARAGIHVIPGCEFTCERGSHIIGLFIRDPLAEGLPAREVFAHVIAQRGLVLIPHPFKPGSGFCALHDDYDDYLPQASLIELYNGGVQEPPAQLARVRALAARHRLKTVAASDAHKAHQVGYYVTAYPELLDGDVRATLRESQGRLLIDSNYLRRPRSLNGVQRLPTYQHLVKRLPRGAKRLLQLGLYHGRPQSRRLSEARYIEVSQEITSA